jgi:hypothetical protein
VEIELSVGIPIQFHARFRLDAVKRARPPESQ